jgi:hypothetical protein
MMSAVYPTLGPELQALVRVAYGMLLLLTLGTAVPHARRYFLGERWGGYSQSSPLVDALQNPYVGALLLVAWFAAAGALVAGRFVMAAAAVNLLLCHYFFVQLRWRSVLRGMGAPGFIMFWLGAAVFLLELTSRHAPAARPIALWTLQIDFAAIMISAGIYKLVAGYRHSHGMELGMANPEWGYWPSFWKTWRPDHPLFRMLDEMAWLTEVGGGVLMLIPQTRALGALAILVSFVFIATQIRLGFLCEMVIVCCLLFLGGGGIEAWIAGALPALHSQAAGAGATLPAFVQTGLIVCCVGYDAFLLPVRAAMFYNQLTHRPLPAAAQRIVDGYANVFGLILWRVFTADVVNFFVRIWELSPDGSRRLISEYRRTGPSRFSQVAEAIAITSVFTTLKYYPSNRDLFVERLLRYARTIPRAAASCVVFEWVGVAMRPAAFEFVPAAEFTVDVNAATVVETALGNEVAVRDIPSFSPVHEGRRPGSYAPLKPRT